MSYEKGLVCFVDILGTRSVKDFQIKHLLHTIWHNEAHNVEKREKSHPHRTMCRKVYTFSDCAYFTYKFKNEVDDERRKPERLFEALTTILAPVQLIMSHGFLVRGGVCYDNFFSDHLGLFGPAVEKSYILESEKAVYPRIILEENIGKILFDLQVHHEFQKFIYRDSEFYYLNSFYNIANSNYFGNISFDRESFFAKLNESYESIMKNNTNDSIKKKWEWIHSEIKKEIPEIESHETSLLDFIFNNLHNTEE